MAANFDRIQQQMQSELEKFKALQKGNLQLVRNYNAFCATFCANVWFWTMLLLVWCRVEVELYNFHGTILIFACEFGNKDALRQCYLVTIIY